VRYDLSLDRSPEVCRQTTRQVSSGAWTRQDFASKILSRPSRRRVWSKISGNVAWLGIIATLAVLIPNAAHPDPYNDAANGRLDSVTDVPSQVRASFKRTEPGEPNKNGDTDFVVVPIPRSDPTLGTGLMLAAAYFYKLDDTSQPSLTGVGAFATSNGSRGWGFGQSTRFGNDRFRLSAAFGQVDLKYDFFGIGSDIASRGLSIPIEQSGYLVAARGAAEVWNDVFPGLKIRHVASKVSVENPIQM